MYYWRDFYLFGSVVTSSLSASQSSTSLLAAQPTTGLSTALSTTTSTASAPQSTACGEIIRSGNFSFNASLVYDCMTSVPFNPAVATRFIAYYNDSIQFQSTLAYLKDPPLSYQQRGVDLVACLGQLQQAIDNGRFGNQYQFEEALARLIQAAHDDHLYLSAGVLSVFSFASPRDLVSVSLDGISEPKVYFATDFIDRSNFTEHNPSALKSINGIDAITYLKDFAASNSFGTLEPHADWNQLMLSPALDILGTLDVFSGGATFYPGANVTWVFENNHTFTEPFLGLYFSQGPTGPLETGGDFYNFFVLGLLPDSFNVDPYDTGGTTTASGADEVVTQSVVTSTSTLTSASKATATTSTVPSWDNSAYPAIPDVSQPDLGTLGGGFLSGYFLRSSSIAVLSIPSFDEYGEAVNTFQNTTQRFINMARKEGMKRVVIDVQGNGGGLPLLAIDTFRRFFPEVNTFAGSRMRAHYAANVMGTTETDFTFRLTGQGDSYYKAMVANEWVVTERIDAATGHYFHSWAEFYGPKSYHNDNFTNVQRYNVSNVKFDDQDSDHSYDPVLETAAPWAASDIIILSDGTCGSSCSLFMESMHHDAGVRVVIAGGSPTAGPMQGASGTRGAREYGIDTLDNNIDFVQRVLNTTDRSKVNFLPNRTEANDVYITYASVNLRDQIRRGETTPLQFAYIPADCRIYFTPQTVYNYTALWKYAADAMWNNPKLCVPGSTGHTDSNSSQTIVNGSKTSSPPPLFTLNFDNMAVPTLLPLPDSLTDDNRSRRVKDISLPSCSVDADCANFNSYCQDVKGCQSGKPTRQCIPKCDRSIPTCNGGNGRTGNCRAKGFGGQVGSQRVVDGWCAVDNLPVCSKGFSQKTLSGPPPPQP